MSSSNFRLEKHVLACHHIRQYPRAVRNKDDILHIAINYYTPLDNQSPELGDLTIVAGHANGVGKELYEPLWDELYNALKASGSIRLRGIWIADVAWQGESGVLNENKLGNDPSWYDHPRDLLKMIDHFRIPQPMVGFGHSQGGNHLTNVALMHPRLFSSLILVDPVILKPTLDQLSSFAPAFASTFRRDIWPSRQEAKRSFRSNKFYQSWDERCLNLWVKHGLRDLPTALHSSYTPRDSASSNSSSITPVQSPTQPSSGSSNDKPVTLTTTKHQEVFTFMRSNHPKAGESLDTYIPNPRTHPDLEAGKPTKPFYNAVYSLTFAQLPNLRPRTFFVWAETSTVGPQRVQQDFLDTTGVGDIGNGGFQKGGVEYVVIQKAGHFVPFEKPKETASHILTWLEKDMAKWRKDEDEEQRSWDLVPSAEKAAMSPDQIWWVQQQIEEKRGQTSKQHSKL